MNFRKNKNGITLIALIITIIVLLILAGISISTLTGENGILNRATSARETNKAKAAEEGVKLEVTASYDNFANVDLDMLKENVKKSIGYTITENEFPVTVVNDGYTFTINQNGKVAQVISDTSGDTPKVEEDEDLKYLQSYFRGRNIIQSMTINEQGEEIFTDTEIQCIDIDSTGLTRVKYNEKCYIVETEIQGQNLIGKTVKKPGITDLVGESKYSLVDQENSKFMDNPVITDASTSMEIYTDVSKLNNLVCIYQGKYYEIVFGPGLDVVSVTEITKIDADNYKKLVDYFVAGGNLSGSKYTNNTVLPNASSEITYVISVNNASYDILKYNNKYYIYDEYNGIIIYDKQIVVLVNDSIYIEKISPSYSGISSTPAKLEAILLQNTLNSDFTWKITEQPAGEDNSVELDSTSGKTVNAKIKYKDGWGNFKVKITGNGQSEEFKIPYTMSTEIVMGG